MARYIVVILFSHLILAPIHALGEDNSQSCIEQFIQDIPDKEYLTADYQENIFTKTYIPSIISASIWYLSVRGMHAFYAEDISEIAGQAAVATLAIDLLITSLTHYISQSDAKNLKAFMNGKLLGFQNEFVSRSLANITVVSTFITGSWVLLGVPFQTAVINAVAICALVYPNLQWMKNLLFRQLPALQDKNLFQRFLGRKKITTQITGSINLAQLQDYLLSFPLEEWFSEHNLQKQSANAMQKKNYRLKILRQTYATKDLLEIKNEIKLHQPKDFESIHTLFQLIAKRNRLIKTKLFLSSFIDMGVSVGFAGGVLLYHLLKLSQQDIPFYEFLSGLL